MINIEPIKAFDDNYIWLMTTNEGSIVIDPGECVNLIKIIEQKNIKLDAILITHHHYDHTGGIEELLIKYPYLNVYGPNNNIDSIKSRLIDGGLLNVIGIDFEIIEIPGHTLDHIAFYAEEKSLVFCGDTLFSGGCGRMFEGTYDQLCNSLQKLANLPDETFVYCTHEYTVKNLEFVRSIISDDDVDNYYRISQNKRNKNEPTLPSSIGLEKIINPFLLHKIPDNLKSLSRVDCFRELRIAKDNF